jgi:transcriptional regulator with XRE-family HTH domain
MDNVKTGLYIKRRIKEKGITQEQLAEMMNISSSAVSQVLSGKNMFDVMNLQELSRILDEPIDRILNAGEDPETYLEILAKKTAEEYKKADPELEKIKDIDHKENTLFDYIIKHRNIDLIRLFDRQIISKFADDIRLATILIINEDIKLLEQLFRDHRFRRKVHFGRDASEMSSIIKNLPKYSDDELEYIKVLSKSKNEKIYEITGCLNINQSNANYFSSFLYFAILNDQPHILKYDHETRLNKQNMSVHNSNHIIESKFSKLLKTSIENKSLNCIDYCYGMISQFNLENYFDNLIETKDKDFIQKFINTYKNKNIDRFYNNNNSGKFDNVKSLKELIKSNNIEILEYSIEFSTQDALDEALYVTGGEQIEIIKLLVSKGARFMYYDSYDSHTKHIQGPLTSMVKYLFDELNKKK